jgi:PST family polysaccharide transporter
VTKPNLLHNILALSGVQALGYLMPLITMPYVTRTLGVDAWGTVALTQVVLGYFSLVTAWGFNLSATRKISAYRNDIEKLSQIFMSTWIAQWILCMGACLILFLFIRFVPYFEKTSSYYLFGSTLILGNVLFPIWFLNGLERMKELAVLQISTRFIAVPLTFILITSQSDAPLLLGISGFTGVLSGFLSIIWIRKNLQIRWHIPTIRQIYTEFKEGRSIFLSTIWISCYTSITPIVLDAISGVGAVAYYAFADRFRNLAQSILNPISQALFPRLSHLFAQNDEEAKGLVIKSSKLILLVSFSSSLILWLFASYIVILMGGESFRPAIAVLRWLAPLPFVISLSNILGIQIMLPNQKTHEFNKILGISGALSLFMITPLIYWQNYIGASINTLITESVVTLLMAVYIWKSEIFKNSGLQRIKNEI